MENVEANQIEEVAGIWKEMLHLLEQNYFPAHRDN